jgi:GNAT superfamily N-acetyltransferase
MRIIKATKNELEELTPLFNSYRVFYKQASSPEAARAFLSQRFEENDSVIFMAVDEEDNGLGFTQLYPSYSSVSMQRTYILNDLFVAEYARNKGVGEALMNAAKQFAIAEDSKGLTLETEVDNPAQHLYERLGWKKDTDKFHYTWET